MKKLLFTLAALFLANVAFAECALFVEDFEVKQNELGTEIVVPVKAHFSARLNAWQLDLGLPAGIQVTEAEAGADQRVTYVDQEGKERKIRPEFSGPSEINRIIAVFMDKGYWQDPNGENPNAWVPYGQIKWEGGDYNEMILLHLSISPDFKGGNIAFNTLASSTPDSRGGTIIENGDENVHFNRICHVKVENMTPPGPDPDPDTVHIEVAAPVITTTMDYANVYVSIEWPRSSGQHIYTGKYTYPRNVDTDYDIEVEAYVRANGRFLESAHTVQTIHVPSRATSPLPIADNWIVFIDIDSIEHWYKMNPDPNGEPNWSIMITLNKGGTWGDTIPFYFTVDGTPYGAETNMQLPAIGDVEQTILNPVFEGENLFYVTANYTYTFGLVFSGDEIQLIIAKGIMCGETPEKTREPIFQGDATDNGYGIATYFVNITPNEPSAIYYRVRYPDESWSEWTEFTETLDFSEEGKYCIEAYAVAENKLPSDTIDYWFVIDAYTLPTPISVDETTVSKAVADVRYFNLAGQEMPEADGITIIVTTYTDGTTTAVKVMK